MEAAVYFKDFLRLADETRSLGNDPQVARREVIAAYCAHAENPAYLADLLGDYAPRDEYSVTLIAAHIGDFPYLLAVPDDIISPRQREALAAVHGGWFEFALSYSGDPAAYAAALWVCAWMGLPGDRNWGRNYDEACEYFAEDGSDTDVLPTADQLAPETGVWSPYIVLGLDDPKRVDLLAERPSQYVWICWRA
jgi:hypothetical protein